MECAFAIPSFSWIAALKEEDNTSQPIDRYRVDTGKVPRKVQTPRLIKLSEAELKKGVLAATDHHSKASPRFIDGSSQHFVLSCDQRRPRYSPIQSIRIVFVQNMTLAFQDIWHIPLPQPRLIDELCATQAGNHVILNVGPNRHYSLGGPFISVRNYLRTHICSALDAFKRQQGSKEYKARDLQRVTDFVERVMNYIPAVVEEIPVVAVYADMRPHNVILSLTTTTDFLLAW
ncbi:hypothetical protein MMC31_002654 [Peltigera leucophlebia]|nr:hypothetical protein [Peltigera leucophlebia]